MSLVLLLLFGPPDPPWSDIRRFEDREVAQEQAARWHRHLRYLRGRRVLCGYDRGRWDYWIEEGEYAAWYWDSLYGVWQVWGITYGDGPGRRALGEFRDALGEDRYYQLPGRAWKPDLLPEIDYSPPAPPCRWCWNNARQWARIPAARK